MELAFWQKCLIWLFRIINFIIPWHRLPPFLAAFNLFVFRTELRGKNLYDTYPTPEDQGTVATCPMEDSKFLAVRNSDGMFNDLKGPRMGCRGMRFGRNVPREFTAKPTDEEIMNPSPRLISERLFKRTEGFKPATIVNLLAAAWIQFNVHDWTNHLNSPTQKYKVPLAKGDPWSDREMKIEKTIVDEPLDVVDLKCPAYTNDNTHWWDASQLYGSDEATTRALRTNSRKHDGQLKVDVIKGEDFLPRGPDGLPKTGFDNNWWLGLELMHTLWALEHNAIAQQLRITNPNFTGDEIFDVARIINVGLMAKIHSLEWTPAILAHPAIELVMEGSWWGVMGERLRKALGHVSKIDTIAGIPGSDADQMGAPYSLTEEFVSVYRLHPLIPDDIAFFDVRDGAHKVTIPIQEVAFQKARTPFEKNKLRWADVFYSFGINYPGAITHNNMPDFLRDVHLPDGRHLDMATVDILRDRERGIPRYNQFRRLFHMPPMKNFLALTGGDTTLANELCEIYNGDIEQVDLLVGCHCEPLPEGFGFSDTAFRVFILMANRRVKSDRFLSTDFKPEIYTHAGIEWVQNNTFKDVLCRHFPELKGSLRDIDNAFAPWEKVGKSAEYKGKETNAKPEAPVVNGVA